MINRKQKSSKTWLVTYSDVITILFIFFVLFFAFSKQQGESEVKDLQIILSIFKGGFGAFTGGENI